MSRYVTKIRHDRTIRENISMRIRITHLRSVLDKIADGILSENPNLMASAKLALQQDDEASKKER